MASRLRNLKKVVLFSLILILCLIFISATLVTVNLTTFSNGLSAENLTFLIDENVTRFLNLPLVNVTDNLTMDLRSVFGDTITDNLSLRFTFDELSGNFSSTGEVSINATPAVSPVHGFVGPLNLSMEVNLTNTIDFPNSTATNVDDDDNFSLSTWIQVIDTTNIESKIYGNTPSITNQFEIRISQLVNFIKIGTTKQGVGSSLVNVGALAQNVWFHLAMTYDGTGKEITAYLNGDNVSTISYAQGAADRINTSQRFSFFDSPASGKFLIDDFRIYNTFLSNDNISTLFQERSILDPKIFVSENISVDITGYLLPNATSSINNTVFNNILSAGCTCQNCSLTSGICSIPIIFNAENTTSSLEYSNLDTSYEFGLDNCSSFTAPAFNYTIRDESTNDLVVTNVSFAIQFQDATSNSGNLAVDGLGRNNYTFCQTPSYANLTGSMINTMTSAGRESRIFQGTDIPLRGIVTAFMTPLSDAVQQVLYIIVDNAFNRIEGANMSFFRIINSTQQLIFFGSSDFNGQVVINQDKDAIYTININATGFPFKSFNLQPVLTSYTIKLGEAVEDLFLNRYSGFRYKIIPDGNVFNITDEFQNFTFITEGSDLEFWGMNLTRHSFECIPADCSSVSTLENGGNVTVSIKLNESGRFYTDLFFKKEGQPLIRINSWPNDAIQLTAATRSLVQLFADIRDNTSPNIRAVVVATVQAVAIAIAASVGLGGMVLAVISTLIIIFFSLPPINFIHPLFGFLIAVLGLIIYAFSQRGQ